ncbi:MAG: YidC/Oxa1 family membrane protein insertase [Clostridiaceae bacterium]|jgi:YidC/Oxa1 family membrane protein insertase|nr:YidC/Oxa1 family membrane protein insertase [Clostridiaceae bacterium]
MISFVPVQLALLDPLYKLFSLILSNLYGWIGNYGLVVILFTVVVRALLTPLGLRSQRNMLRQQLLQPDIQEIQRRYKKNPERQQELTQELYKKHGISMAGGCITSMIPLLIIWPLIYIFRSPLRWVGKVPVANLRLIAGLLQTKGLMTEAQVSQVALMDIPVINGLRESASALATSVENGWIQLEQIVNTRFLGMDLARTPSWKPSDWFGPEWRTWLPLLILVIVTISSYFLQMYIARISTPFPRQTKEEKAREKSNPAKSGQTPDNQMAGMGKSMQILMPLIMLYTMFTFPAAMGLYWLFQNLMYLLQSLLGYQFYVKPLKREFAADAAPLPRRAKEAVPDTSGSAARKQGSFMDRIKEMVNKDKSE